jgi:hypothetical protein
MGWVADDKKPAGLRALDQGTTGYAALHGILAGKPPLVDCERAPGSVRIRTGGDSPRAVESGTRKGNARDG